MRTNIRRIGNSQGIILPKSLLQEIGSPVAVDVNTTEDGGIIIYPSDRSIRRKPRNENERNGFYLLMKAKLDDDIKNGKTVWINDREIEMSL
jgi:antitoxin component of MazEF toxin-antitoxin module